MAMNINLASKFLITKKQVYSSSEIPIWFQEEYKKFDEIVSDNAFVCHFGTMAHRKEELCFSYIEGDDFETLPETLKEFLQLSISNPEKRYAWVLFVKPNSKFKDFKYCNEYFWDMLNYLHKHDDDEWPNEWPTNPDDPKWEFVFNKEPIFVSVNGPLYKKRITRNLGDSLVVIFQPRRIFKDISHETTAGKKAINLIRKKVELKEKLPIHPDLGGYGDPQKREWKQYLITDDEIGSVNLKCPFKYLNKD